MSSDSSSGCLTALFILFIILMLCPASNMIIDALFSDDQEEIEYSDSTIGIVTEKGYVRSMQNGKIIGICIEGERLKVNKQKAGFYCVEGRYKKFLGKVDGETEITNGKFWIGGALFDILDNPQ